MNEEKQKITRKYKEKEITFERKRKAINQDTQKQIRISTELLQKINKKIAEDSQVKDFSSLVRTLIEKYLEK